MVFSHFVLTEVLVRSLPSLTRRNQHADSSAPNHHNG